MEQVETTESGASLGPPVGMGRTAEVYAWGDGRILKLYRPEIPRQWVWREAEVGRIVAGAGLAAPNVFDVVEVAGRLGIVYERVSGPSMLDQLARQPWILTRSARQFAAVHAEMHECPGDGLPPQREGLAGAIRYAPPLPETARQCALDALARMPDGDYVCHGDYHPDNLIASSHGPIVIDWMTATRGSPAADVARTVLLFRVGVLPDGMPASKRIMTEFIRRAFLAAYLAAYRGLRLISDAEIEAWIPLLAAARLNEHIATEEHVLLRLADRVG